MEPEKWAQITDRARQEELAARSRSFDPARMPFPAAINTRLMVGLYDRVEALEKELAAVKQHVGIKAEKQTGDGVHCPHCGVKYSLSMEAGVLIGCQPGHCSVQEGRRTEADAKKAVDAETARTKEEARAKAKEARA